MVDVPQDVPSSRTVVLPTASPPLQPPPPCHKHPFPHHLERFVRSKSLPATEFACKLAVNRHDSIQSSQSNTSAGAATTSSLGGRDSGIGSELLDGSSGPAQTVPCSCCCCCNRNKNCTCRTLNGGGGGGSDNRNGTCSNSSSGVSGGILIKDSKKSGPADFEKTATIRLHYYPEGGWGWVICVCAFLVEIISYGLQTAFGIFYLEIMRKYGRDKYLEAGCVGAMSMSMSLFLSPVIVAFCRRKSTRLTAVIGGMVTALGCLFTSFTSQFHQLFFSYGVVVGLGVGMCRVTSGLMVGQYFKRKREAVEMGLQCAIGLGILIASILYKQTISSMGWRLGLQTLTGVTFATFFLGVLYRSASLYHPQRRAILHLKNQKRKVKDKAKLEDKPHFFDFTTLKSRTVQILLLSTAISSMGINAPIFFLAYEGQKQGLDEESVLLVQTFLGVAMIVGSSAFGLVVVMNSTECRIARHYLCQASGFMLSVSLLSLTIIKEYHGYVFFSWVYGIFLGGYVYSLKLFTYEKVRARNFARTWSFVQWAQAVPIVVGTPITSYINGYYGHRTGFYFSSVCAITGCVILFLIDVHRRSLGRDKVRGGSSTQRNRTSSTLGNGKYCKDRRGSLPECDNEETLAIIGQRRLSGYGDVKRPELLTCISEEGLADIPDNILEEFFALGDCMTSCDQVEHYLMLSEYENNLNKTNEIGIQNRDGGGGGGVGRHRKHSILAPLREDPVAVVPEDDHRTLKPINGGRGQEDHEHVPKRHTNNHLSHLGTVIDTTL